MQPVAALDHERLLAAAPRGLVRRLRDCVVEDLLDQNLQPLLRLQLAPDVLGDPLLRTIWNDRGER